MAHSDIDMVVAVQFIYTWATFASTLSMAPMFPLLEAELISVKLKLACSRVAASLRWDTPTLSLSPSPTFLADE